MLIFTTFSKATVRVGLALRSWREVYPDARILAFTENEALLAQQGPMVWADAFPDGKTRRVDLRVEMRAVATNAHGTPLVSDMYSVALAHADADGEDVLLFLTSDLILLGDLGRAVPFLLTKRPFVAVGRRRDLRARVDFTVDWWQARLRVQADLEGRTAPPCGSDFFLFSRDAYEGVEIPPFAVGRCRYDNWLMWDARKRDGVTLADLSDVACVVHQWHPTNTEAWRGEEIKRNEELARAVYPDWTPLKGWTTQANLVVTEGDLALHMYVEAVEQKSDELADEEKRAAEERAFVEATGIGFPNTPDVERALRVLQERERDTEQEPVDRNARVIEELRAMVKTAGAVVDNGRAAVAKETEEALASIDGVISLASEERGQNDGEPAQ